MSKKKETRRGGYLGRVPRCVCSPANAQENNSLRDGSRRVIARNQATGEYLRFMPGVYAPGSPMPWGCFETTKVRLKATQFPCICSARTYLEEYKNVTPIRVVGTPNKKIGKIWWNFEGAADPAQGALL